MLGPAAQAVVAAEILDWHQSLGEDFYQRLLSRVGSPARGELFELCHIQPRGNLGRLRNEILERQFGLSPALSQQILFDLFEAHFGWWETCAHLNCRRALNGGVSLDEEPSSKDLAAWASWSLRSGSSSWSSRSQCQGYSAGEDPSPLLPVQVQHDRSPHAERQLLLTMLRICKKGRHEQITVTPLPSTIQNHF